MENRNQVVKFNKELLQGKKVAVNCITEEQAQQFVDWVCSLGVAKTRNTNWEFCKAHTCYDLEEGLYWSYCNIDWYKTREYKVISYEEALLKPSEQNVEEEIEEETPNQNTYIISYEVLSKGRVLTKAMNRIQTQEIELDGLTKFLIEEYNNRYGKNVADGIFIVNIFKD